MGGGGVSISERRCAGLLQILRITITYGNSSNWRSSICLPSCDEGQSIRQVRRSADQPLRVDIRQADAGTRVMPRSRILNSIYRYIFILGDEFYATVRSPVSRHDHGSAKLHRVATGT